MENRSYIILNGIRLQVIFFQRRGKLTIKDREDANVTLSIIKYDESIDEMIINIKSDLIFSGPYEKDLFIKDFRSIIESNLEIIQVALLHGS